MDFNLDLNAILQPLLLALATALAGVLVNAAMKWTKKLGLNVEAEQQAKLESYVREQILRVAEQAAQRAKLDGVIMTGAAKLDAVLTATLEKFPRITAKEASDIVHASLPQLGQGALAGAVALGKALGTAEPTTTVVAVSPVVPSL